MGSFLAGWARIGGGWASSSAPLLAPWSVPWLHSWVLHCCLDFWTSLSSIQQSPIWTSSSSLRPGSCLPGGWAAGPACQATTTSLAWQHSSKGSRSQFEDLQIKPSSETLSTSTRSSCSCCKAFSSFSPFPSRARSASVEGGVQRQTEVGRRIGGGPTYHLNRLAQEFLRGSSRQQHHSAEDLAQCPRLRQGFGGSRAAWSWGRVSPQRLRQEYTLQGRGVRLAQIEHQDGVCSSKRGIGACATAVRFRSFSISALRAGFGGHRTCRIWCSKGYSFGCPRSADRFPISATGVGVVCRDSRKWQQSRTNRSFGPIHCGRSASSCAGRLWGWHLWIFLNTSKLCLGFGKHGRASQVDSLRLLETFPGARSRRACGEGPRVGTKWGRPCWRGSNFTWQTMCLRLQCQDPVTCSSRQRARSWYCRRTSTLAKEEAQSSLAESLEALTSILPQITASLKDLQERTEGMEAQRPADRVSALRRPPTGLSSPSVPAAQLLKEMPRPKSFAASTKQPHESFSEEEAREMSLEALLESQDLTRAVIAQSQALTTFISHLTATSSDPFHKTRVPPQLPYPPKAVSRAKLQAELAAQRGTFFVSVIQQMARRMQPAVAVDADMLALRSRGITPTQYLERFGGYGQCRDIGFFTWQVAGGTRPQIHDGRQPPCREGRAEFVVCGPGADGHGQWQHAGRPLAVADRGPSSSSVRKQVGGVSSIANALCANSPPTLDHNSPTILEGDGHHLGPAVRSCGESKRIQQGHYKRQHRPDLRSRSPKEEAQGKGRRERPQRTATEPSSRRRGIESDDARLEEQVSAAQILAPLPRWILRTKTRFAAFLARSFHIQRCGSSPASAVFPIPAPHLRRFDAQDTPKLNARKWARLCIQRALHVVVLALNFIHNNNAMFPFQRWRGDEMPPTWRSMAESSLFWQCCRPGFHPLPGRSGFEFIARLAELEHFASSHEAFCHDLYMQEASQQIPRPLHKVGRIQK